MERNTDIERTSSIKETTYDKKTWANYWKIIARNGFTLLILDIFIFIAVTLMNLMPSVYDRVEKDFGLDSPAPIMILEGIFIITAATIAVVWGYFIDKIDRKKILFYSMSVWIIGATICAFAPNFTIFTIGRIITALGLGAQMPSTYSIMADIVPSRYWSTLYGWLALLNAFCNGMGNFLSGFLAPMNIWGMGWQFPFAFLSILSIINFFLLALVKLPNRGASSIEDINERLGEEIRSGAISYNYTIKKEDLLPLWRVDTNRWMLYLCFFAVIPGATLGSFLVYYMIHNPFSSFPDAIRTQVAAIFAGMTGIGYLLGTMTLGPVFDYLHSKSPRNRPRFTFWGLLLAVPLIIIAFLAIVPVDYNSLGLTEIDPNDPSFSIEKYVIIVSRIFELYPSYSLYFFALLLGGFFAAPITINRTPTILEVNLPEHMGTSQAILNFSDQLGKGFTFLFLAFQYIIYKWLFNFVDERALIIISVLFYIPPILWWRKISMRIDEEIIEKRKILEKRTEELEEREKEKIEKAEKKEKYNNE